MMKRPKKLLLVDPNKCTGCHLCVVACSLTNAGVTSRALSRVRIVEMDWEHKYPAQCLQCEDAVCVTVCPTGAIARDFSDGVVKIDHAKCIHCRLCALSCPFGGIDISPQGFVFKCELCDGDPECVKSCPEDAIRYVEPQKAVIKSRKKKIAETWTSLNLASD
ncbi:MAG: 4Fe-4S dicluster domain-containing protein [Promethearchaeota archaeon]